MKSFASYLFLLLLSGSSLMLSAQEQRIFYGGGFAGISTSQLSGDQLSGFKKVGVYAGAFVNARFTPKSSLQLELSFIQKGSRSVSKTRGLVYAVNLQYLEMPLLYKWQFSKRFGLEAGPSLGYLIKTTDVERDAYGTLTPSRPPFNRIDLSVSGGFSVKIVEHLKFTVRGIQSVLPVRKHESGAVYRLNRGQYNSVLAMVLHVEY